MEIMKDDGIISCFNLPPGFLFSPTDEELVLHFLYPKATYSLHHQRPSHPNIIPDLDISLTDPWELNNGKALGSGNQYYFYTKVNNDDENRRTENGYWKEIGVTEPIISSSSGGDKKKVGMKKYLVFHIGEGLTDDDETNWVMQEYHHVWSSHGFDDTTSTNTTASSHWSWSGNASGRPKHEHQSWRRWVLCRVYEKSSRFEEQDVVNNCSSDNHDDDDDSGTELSWLDEVYLSLDIDDHLEEEE